MSAPLRFVDWLSRNKHTDRRFGHTYNYHPRSDFHSVALCTYIAEDLLSACTMLREQAQAGAVAYGINTRHTWPNGKRKMIDLAIGIPKTLDTNETSLRSLRKAKAFDRVLLSCEAKTAMTEHKKSQPRIFDELGSSHEIVHQGRPEALAAGITVVNIARTFISPLRQTTADEVHITKHRQPDVTASMIQHLRGLPIREKVGDIGFDAYCTFVVNCDNLTEPTLWTDEPAPQPGDPDHYQTFLHRLSAFYAERFSSLTA